MPPVSIANVKWQRIKCILREKLFHMREFLPAGGHPTPKKGSLSWIQGHNQNDLDVPNPTIHLNWVQAHSSSVLPRSAAAALGPTTQLPLILTFAPS